MTLSQNFPNPFNPSTTIRLSIDDRQLTIVNVYDLLGREVAVLLNEVKDPGNLYTDMGCTRDVKWHVHLQDDGRDPHTLTRTMTLVR